ncbi:DUF4394 domain-containing protein [Singulisphaera sp. Ch08]|uniref:DUF4394 domain-containing protein n=1 Tax=Singulisphaera sp. Ch08 TaxID=3120278 RepID=A0AAU7CM02_9BACT
MRRHRAIGSLEQCEARTLLTTLYGVTAASSLIQFDSAAPAIILRSNPITNIGAGETIQGIDFRPANGQLYALTTDTNHTGRLYTIDTTSAAATLAATIDVPVTGTRFGLDFNPIPDRLRIVSDTDLNLRVNVATGAATADGTLNYLAGDSSAGQAPNVVGSAYRNNFPGASATTLYQIDSHLDILAIQSPPNDGTLATVGSLGVDATSVVGFDILTTGEKANPTNQAIAALQVGGSTGLYTVNLATGSATLVGTIGDGATQIVGMTVAPATQALVNAANAFGIDASNNNLVRFNTQTPGTIVSSQLITGLQQGETILGLDVQPTTGVLYGLGSTSRLYTIDTLTGVATPVIDRVTIMPFPLPILPPFPNKPFAPALSGTEFGFDFDPTGTHIRVVSNTGQSLWLDPYRGLVNSTGGPLTYSTGDPNFGQNPHVSGVASLNNVSDATTPTLYAIDTTLDVLAIEDPAHLGTLSTVGALGIDASAVVGFDIRTVDGLNYGYATLVSGGTTSLYRIDLTTGAATLIAPVGAPLRALAIAPEGFRARLEGSTVILTGSSTADTLVIDQTGGLLRHNQAALGAPGYHSEFDFDTTLPGDQTLSSTDTNILVVVNAGQGFDKVTLGSESAPLSSLATRFSVNGEEGYNQLTLDDSASGLPRNIDILPGYITGFGSPVAYSTAFNTSIGVFVNAGTQNDTFSLAPSFGFTVTRLRINGGLGIDTLNADAQGAHLFTTGSSLIFRPNQAYSAEVAIEGLEHVNLANVAGEPVTPVTPPNLAISLAVAGTEFADKVVAQFTDLDPGAKAADYHVTIQWGDGTSSPGRVVQVSTIPARFYILGTHRYSTAGRFTVSSTIRDTGGSFTESAGNVTTTTTYEAEVPVTLQSPILVTEPPIMVQGQLDAASDTGVSNQDGITNDNTPTFTGTTAPGAIVKIYNGTDPATRQLIATGVADSLGAWQATALNPLADGLYTNLELEATFVNGQAQAIASLANLMVDTAGPTVTKLEFRRLQGQINASFQDDGSGLNQAGLTDLANYVFAGIGPVGLRNRRTSITTASTTPSGIPANAQVVNLSINNGRRLRAGRYTFTAYSGGIEDLAGNALDGEFIGRFPSGNARPGGHFVAALRPFRKLATGSTPDGSAATNAPGNRQAALRKNGGNAHPAGPSQQAHLTNRPHAAASLKSQGRTFG